MTDESVSEESLYALTELEDALTAWFDKEETRINDEVIFLKEIYAGLTGGAGLELVSTNASNIFLVGAVDSYFPS